jgi:micrococcal nuclease
MTTMPDLRLQSKLYYYAGHVTSVYDGDTFTVDLDLGLGIWRQSQTIRLWKVNTPEVRGADKERGLEVRDFVAALILDKVILLRTILDKRGSDRTEKFGRLLGEALVPGEDGEVINLNELLLEQGMAVPMDESGSTVRGTGRPAGEQQALPDAVHCPYCGEVRLVDATTAWVAQCPNCLDEPYPWRTHP